MKKMLHWFKYAVSDILGNILVANDVEKVKIKTNEHEEGRKKEAKGIFTLLATSVEN